MRHSVPARILVLMASPEAHSLVLEMLRRKSLEDAEEVPGAMDPDWWTSKKLTPEAIAEARKDVWVPYATARKNEKLLTIEMGLGKSVRVVHGGDVLYKGADATKAIEIFTNTYHDRVTGIIPEKD